MKFSRTEAIWVPEYAPVLTWAARIFLPLTPRSWDITQFRYRIAGTGQDQTLDFCLYQYYTDGTTPNFRQCVAFSVTGNLGVVSARGYSDEDPPSASTPVILNKTLYGWWDTYIAPSNAVVYPPYSVSFMAHLDLEWEE